MTAKEKAKELIDKFHELTDLHVQQWKAFGSQKWNAKESALICVDKILSAYKTGYASSSRDTDYWTDVRKEIENY